MTAGFAGAWRHRRWGRLLASYAISTPRGVSCHFVALAVFLIETTGSAGWIAAAAIARLIAYALFGPPAQRHRRGSRTARLLAIPGSIFPDASVGSEQLLDLLIGVRR